MLWDSWAVVSIGSFEGVLPFSAWAGHPTQAKQPVGHIHVPDNICLQIFRTEAADRPPCLPKSLRPPCVQPAPSTPPAAQMMDLTCPIG